MKSYQNFIVKDLNAQFFGMDIKEKVIINIKQKKKDFFSNQTLSSKKNIYLFWTIQMKILLLEDSKLKGITYQK